MRLQKVSLGLIADKYLRNALDYLYKYLEDEAFLKGEFKHTEVSYPKAGSYVITHLCNFVPKDILVTYYEGPGAYTIEYTQTDANFIYITTTGKVTLRLYYGRYGES